MLGAAAAIAGAGGSDDPQPAPKLDLFHATEGTVPSCSAASCKGCCTEGTCRPGDNVAACGTGGGACTICQANQLCQAGTCSSPPCDKSTCPGCCASGTCPQGTSESACGTGGGTCATCASTEACLDHQCVTKGPASYRVTLVRAKVPNWLLACQSNKTNPEYENGGCDLYVVLKVGTLAEVQSSIRQDNNAPEWNEELLTATEADILAKFQVAVWDKDILLNDQVASCAPKLTQADLASGKVQFGCQYATEIVFSFQKL